MKSSTVEIAEKESKITTNQKSGTVDNVDYTERDNDGGAGGGGGGGGESGGHGHMTSDHPTSYLETMMHLFKGNVGPGLFAMGDAFKNAGLVLAPILTCILGFVCVHSQRILISQSHKMKEKYELKEYPDFAETVEMCFENGIPKLRGWSKLMKKLVNIFLCVTQFGFCCVYFVFISSNLKQIFDVYNINLDDRVIMLIILVPILLPSLITNLKYLAPCSTIANFCMITGIGITLYFSFQDLSEAPARNNVATIRQLPLFFGTAIFAFEGISLVLPLQNSMKNPTNFHKMFGVLNVGMLIVTCTFVTVGFVGYLKYGESVEGSLTLNLPDGNKLAQSVKVLISIGVLLGYALQFYVAIQIMWPSVKKRFQIEKNSLISEILFRTFWVFITFLIAETVPKLSLFISLIGALCSTALALVFPPVIELVSAWDNLKSPNLFLVAKNVLILIVAFLGFITGTYESISAIIQNL